MRETAVRSFALNDFAVAVHIRTARIFLQVLREVYGVPSNAEDMADAVARAQVVPSPIYLVASLADIV